MLFASASPSRAECLDSISAALQHDAGRIYLDANVLIHCYEMSAAASETLLRTLEKYEGRVGVPLWAARETWDYVTKRTNKRPLKSLADRMQQDFKRFQKETTRYIDDSALKGVGKAEYQKELGDALGEALTLIQRVSEHAPKIDDTTDRLMPFIDQRRLPSKLAVILDEVSRTAGTRIAHRIPPGFADAAPPAEEGDEQASRRKGKSANPHGDMIIWFEILQDCARNDAEHLVVVTKDTNKDDWVYTPVKVRDERGRRQDNRNGITLPLPLLVYEAMQACPTLKTVNIISVELLATVWTMQRFDVSDLAAALQAEDDDAVGQPDAESDVRTAQAGGEPYFAEFGSTDMSFEPDPNDELDQAILDLGVNGWKAQNQAVRRLQPQLGRLSRAQRIQFGREIAAAANTGAVEPAEFLDRVLGDEGYGRAVRSDLLIGALAETYIAETGEPRKPSAGRAIAEAFYHHHANAELAGAYDAVIGRLGAVRREYLALPSDGPQDLKFEFSLQKDALVNVVIQDVALLEQDAPSSRALQHSGNDVTMSVDSLLDRLATEFVVPRSSMISDLAGATTITVPEHIGFAAWGPKTGMYLR